MLEEQYAAMLRGDYQPDLPPILDGERLGASHRAARRRGVRRRVPARRGDVELAAAPPPRGVRFRFQPARADAPCRGADTGLLVRDALATAGSSAASSGISATRGRSRSAGKLVAPPSRDPVRRPSHAEVRGRTPSGDPGIAGLVAGLADSPRQPPVRARAASSPMSSTGRGHKRQWDAGPGRGARPRHSRARRVTALRVCFFAERQVGIGSVAGVVRRFAEERATWAHLGGRHLPSAAGPSLLPAGARGSCGGSPRPAKAAARPARRPPLLDHTRGIRHAALRRIRPVSDGRDAVAARRAGRAIRPRGLDPSAAAPSASRGGAHFPARPPVPRLVKWAAAPSVRDYGIPRRGPRRPSRGGPCSLAVPHVRSGACVPRLLFVGGDFVAKAGGCARGISRAAFWPRRAGRGHPGGRRGRTGVRVHRGLWRAAKPCSDSTARRKRSCCLQSPTATRSLPWNAMASGLPVVTTRVGANPEIVEEGRRAPRRGRRRRCPRQGTDCPGGRRGSARGDGAAREPARRAPLRCTPDGDRLVAEARGRPEG